MKNQKLMVIQSFYRQRVAKLSEQSFLQSVGNRWGLEFVLERGGPASFKENVMTRQDYTKVEHVKTCNLRSRFAKDPTVLI